MHHAVGTAVAAAEDPERLSRVRRLSPAELTILLILWMILIVHLATLAGT